MLFISYIIYDILFDGYYWYRSVNACNVKNRQNFSVDNKNQILQIELAVAFCCKHFERYRHEL